MEYLRLSTQTNYFYSQEFQHSQNSLAVSEEEHYERQESRKNTKCYYESLWSFPIKKYFPVIYHCEEAVFYFVCLGNTNLCITGKLASLANYLPMGISPKVQKVNKSTEKLFS